MKVKPLRFAGTPTHDRPGMYADLRANIDPQIDEFITVTHGPGAQAYATGTTIAYDGALPDLAIMWNMILDRAHELAAGRPYYVAILNDDALVADDWFDLMVDAIERNGSAGASTPRAPGKARSIFGGAFVVKGDIGIRMTGVCRWWWTDDEIQKQCQALGGFTIVPNVHAVNRLANQSTRADRELQAMNSADWPAFNRKYGMPEAAWANTEYHVVISAPSGEQPLHIIETLDGRDYTVMVDGWEPEQLAAAADMFSRFVYLKESARILPGFWEAIDSERGSCWLFARPSCYMGIYDAPTLKKMLAALPPTTTKEESIHNEWRIHGTVNWRSVWPDITDANALRVENGELIIGNRFIEKSKGTARCSLCATSTAPGVCTHLLAKAGHTTSFNVTVVVATCGTDTWKGMGDAAAKTVPAGVPIVRIHDPNGTVAGVRNAGLAQVTTEYVCWLDADDAFTPDYFQHMAAGSANIRQPSVKGWSRSIEPPQCGHHGPKHGATRECLAFGNPFSPGAVVLTELAKAHPWDEQWPVLEDFAFWRTICANPTVTVETIPGAVYITRARSNTTPRNRSVPRADWQTVGHDIAAAIEFA